LHSTPLVVLAQVSGLTGESTAHVYATASIF
jgi:hypothetical protein